MERFNKALEILEELKEEKKKIFISDLKLTSIAERNIQISTEFIVDLSNFIISKLDLEIPENYKKSIEKIYELKIVNENLKKDMIELVGLRNIIVHMYADVKYDLIFDSLDKMVKTLRKFCKKLLNFCEERGLNP